MDHMRFELKHNNSLDKSILTDRKKEYNFVLPIAVTATGKWITTAKNVPLLVKWQILDQWFPAEVADFEMTSIPTDDGLNYASFYDMNEDGDLPDDLTQTEKILTRLLWGSIDRTKAILIVSALEDMEIDDVTKNLDHLGLF
jgi:hypothetical protein